MRRTPWLLCRTTSRRPAAIRTRRPHRTKARLPVSSKSPLPRTPATRRPAARIRRSCPPNSRQPPQRRPPRPPQTAGHSRTPIFRPTGQCKSLQMVVRSTSTTTRRPRPGIIRSPTSLVQYRRKVQHQTEYAARRFPRTRTQCRRTL